MKKLNYTITSLVFSFILLSSCKENEVEISKQQNKNLDPIKKMARNDDDEGGGGGGTSPTPPDFSITYLPSLTPGLVQFANSSSTCTLCTWDLGNDEIYTGLNPPVTRYNPGRYTITLTRGSTIPISTSKEIYIPSVPNLFAYYPFDNTYKDYSIRDEHLEVEGQIRFDLGRDGILGHSIDFSYKNYIKLPGTIYNTKFTPDGVTRTSISLWIYPVFVESYNLDNIIIGMHTVQTNAEGTPLQSIPVLMLQQTGSQIDVALKGQFWDGEVNPFQTLVRAHTWYHVVITGGPNGQKMYVNGNLIGQRSLPINHGLMTENFLGHGIISKGSTWMGSTPAAQNYIMDYGGLIDEFRVYNKELTETEVQQLYHEF